MYDSTLSSRNTCTCNWSFTWIWATSSPREKASPVDTLPSYWALTRDFKKAFKSSVTWECKKKIRNACRKFDTFEKFWRKFRIFFQAKIHARADRILILPKVWRNFIYFHSFGLTPNKIGLIHHIQSFVTDLQWIIHVFRRLWK